MDRFDEEAGSVNTERKMRPLANITLQLDNRTAQALNEAEFAIRELEKSNADPLEVKFKSDASKNIEVLADFKMDGRRVESRRFFYDRLGRTNSAKENSTAQAEKSAALQSGRALDAALVNNDTPITTADFNRIHRELLAGTTRESFIGRMRNDTQQIGGNRFHTVNTTRLTPDPEDIDALLNDLAVFCDEGTMPAIAQAALAHAQFIGIHPYARGGGKMARALIHMVLRKRGLTTNIVVPISLSMANSMHDYESGLMRTLDDLADPSAPTSSLNKWLEYFARCCLFATNSLTDFEAHTAELRAAWKTRMNPRSDSATNLLMYALRVAPVITTHSASALIGRGFKSTNSGIEELVDAGILMHATEGKRNRVFECPSILEVYTSIPGFH